MCCWSLSKVGLVIQHVCMFDFTESISELYTWLYNGGHEKLKIQCKLIHVIKVKTRYKEKHTREKHTSTSAITSSIVCWAASRYSQEALVIAPPFSCGGGVLATSPCPTFLKTLHTMIRHLKRGLLLRNYMRTTIDSSFWNIVGLEMVGWDK